MKNSLSTFMTALRVLFLVAVLQTVGSASLAALSNEDVQSILERAEKLARSSGRPSVEEMLSVFSPEELVRTDVRKALREFGGDPSGNAYAQYEIGNVKAQLAQHIARLEAIMPGGTYGYLGRDSALLADMIRSFYMMLGQSNRAIRIRASGTSFGPPADVVADFLKTEGLDFDGFSKFNGLLILDTTSYSPGSQSTQLSKAAIARLVKLGHSGPEIVQKFNVGNVNGGGLATSSFKDIQESLKSQAKLPNGTLGRALDVTVFPRGRTGNTMALTYAAEWHDSFTQFYREGDKVLTSFAEYPIENRRLALTETLLAIGSAMMPELAVAVQMEAKKFGYEFPIDKEKASDFAKRAEEMRVRIEAELKEQKRLELEAAREAAKRLKVEAGATMKTLLEQTPKLEGEKEYSPWRGFDMKIRLTANGSVLANWYQQYRHVDNADIVFVQAVARMRANGQIGDRDVRRLFALPLAQEEISENLQKTIEGLAEQSPDVLNQFSDPERVADFVDETRFGQQAKANYQILRERISKAPKLCKAILDSESNWKSKRQAEAEAAAAAAEAAAPKKKTKKGSDEAA